MARIFGHAWTAKYGETDDGTWAAVLSGFTGNQIKRGIRYCLNDWRDSFPPTPGQFRGIILDTQIEAHRQLKPVHLLERKAASDETSQAFIAKIRRELGMEAIHDV